MTSTSKSGMVVTSSIRVVPRTMMESSKTRSTARELMEPAISTRLALKIGAVCALVPLVLWLAGMMWRMR